MMSMHSKLATPFRNRLMHGAVATQSALHAALDCLVPQTCLTCGTWIAGGMDLLCPACRAEFILAAQAPYCQRCGRTMSPLSIYDEGCARCVHEPWWNVRRIVRVGEYAGSMRAAALAMKYGGHARVSQYVGDQVVAALSRESWCDEIDALVPVPMHALRRWQRPLEHARALADAMAGRINRARRRRDADDAPPLPRLRVLSAVRRQRYAPSQSDHHSTTAKFKNVRGCFQAVGEGAVDGLTVCIVDNLLVSGATLTEVSKALRRAGAKRIYAAVFARARDARGPDLDAVAAQAPHG